MDIILAAQEIPPDCGELSKGAGHNTHVWNQLSQTPGAKGVQCKKKQSKNNRALNIHT